MNIRTIKPSEYREMFELIWDVFRIYVQPDWSSEGTTFFFEHFISENADYRQKVDRGEETCYGAFEGDKLVGVMTVSQHGNLSCAFVLPDYQRKGIGRALFQRVCEHIRAEHPLPFEIKLNASPYAVPFYRTLGFQAVAEKSEYHGMVSTPMVMRIDSADMLSLSKLSSRYDVRLLNESDVTEIFELCVGNPMYYEYCPPPVSKESILADMDALPEGQSPDDKYYVGYFDNEELIAVMDVILRFPEQDVAWIGFFMTKSSIQRRGIGAFIIDEACACLATHGIREVRLGYMKDNPQCHGFWVKARFVFVSESEDTTGRNIIVASRNI